MHTDQYISAAESFIASCKERGINSLDVSLILSTALQLNQVWLASEYTRKMTGQPEHKCEHSETHN